MELIAYSNFSKKDNLHIKLKSYFDNWNEIGDKNSYADSLKGIGHVYKEQKKYEKALQYYNNALEVFNNLDNKNAIAHIYDLIGHLYEEQHDYTNTHIYWCKAKEIHLIESSFKSIVEHFPTEGKLFFHDF